MLYILSIKRGNFFCHEAQIQSRIFVTKHLINAGSFPDL